MNDMKSNSRGLRPSAASVAILGLAGLCAVAGTASAQTSTTPTTASPMKVFNYPYCELIPDTVANGTITEHVFNTLGFNTCPASTFNTITEQNIVDAYNAQYPPAAGASPATSATINGRRFWVMSTIQSTGGVTSSPDTLTVNGMQLGLKAVLTTPQGSATVGQVPYTAQTVQRNTVYVFKANRPVFELVSPTGQVYVMQSYTLAYDPKLNLKLLQNVKYMTAKNKMPKGWVYRTRKLKRDLTLTAAGTTQVVNDQLRNTYQVNPAASRPRRAQG